MDLNLPSTSVHSHNPSDIIPKFTRFWSENLRFKALIISSCLVFYLMLCTLALFPSRLPLPPSKAIHLLSHLHPSNALHCTRSALLNKKLPILHASRKSKEKKINAKRHANSPPIHPSIDSLYRTNLRYWKFVMYCFVGK